MSDALSQRPVAKALAGYESLLAGAYKRPLEKLPSERALAARWNVSQAAVNRAALQLIAQGRLRREGYGLYPSATVAGAITGARLVFLTHRGRRYVGLGAEAARRGVHAAERYFVGRDSLRRQLRAAIAEKVDGVVFRLSDGGWEWDAEVAEMDRAGIPCVAGEAAPAGVAVVAEDWHEATGLLVSQLFAQGHREMALLGSLRRAHRSVVVRHAYEERCLRLGLTASAGRIIEMPAHTDEAIAESCRELLARHGEISALVVYDEDHATVVSEALRAAGVDTPGRISLVSVGDGANARNASPPVSSAAFDSTLLTHLALDQICRMVEQVRTIGRVASRPRVLLGSFFHARESVRTIGRSDSPSVEQELANQFSRSWPMDAEARRRDARAMRTRSHALSAGAPDDHFEMIDLRGLANRALTRQNGWLGQFPLLHFPPGRQVVHGVPFDVIDERMNDGRAALVLRSQRVGAGQVNPPVQVRFPVDRRVRAAYFLHACGFAGVSAPFAWYDFELAGNRTVSVPLVARGLGPVRDGVLAPNIQDWWSDFPQIEGPGVLPFVVAENDDPFLYERYLYTMEWRAPEGEASLGSIRVSCNPSQPTTLGLLAVTLLLAK